MSDAMELDPANPQIVALIERLERRDAERAKTNSERLKLRDALPLDEGPF
jgi:hypothetical protein